MNRTTKGLVAGILISGLIGLGAADALIKEHSLTANIFTFATSFKTHDIPEASLASGLLSSFQDHGFTLTDTREPNILGSVLSDQAPVHTSVIMMNDDRIAFAAWTELSDAELTFLALKEVLHDSFSKEVRELLDESHLESQTEFHILTFIDPHLSDERFVFVRINQLLIEFHVRDGFEETIWDFIDEFSLA